jgi:hypothetical protein
MSVPATKTPSAADIAAALVKLNAALMALSALSTAVSTTPLPQDFKLFELKLALWLLGSLSPAAKWHCTSAPTLVLSGSPRELGSATVFTHPGFALAVALNVNVHYPGSPWRGSRHEADLAVFDSALVGTGHLGHASVSIIVEAKYRPVIAKSVLRELAFIATQLPVAPSPHARLVTLAVPFGPWKNAQMPTYWTQAHTHYGVSVVLAPFP